MDEKKRSRRMLIVALACTAVVIVLLFLAFLIGQKNTRTEQIILPEAPAQPEQTSTAEPEEPDLLQVSKENALDVLKSLPAPTAYHRVLNITICSDSAKLEQNAEIWMSRDTLRADIVSSYDAKHLLTDGKTLHLWYDGGAPVEIPLTEDISADDLVGIPEYETVFSLPERSILEAELVEMEQNGGSGSVFVSTINGEVTQNYWISLDTGILFRQEMQVAGKMVYTMEQTALEILAESDEAFSDVFHLPDGEEPFKAG